MKDFAITAFCTIWSVVGLFGVIDMGKDFIKSWLDK